MSSIHDLAALAAEIRVNRPEERVGEDYVDGQSNEDDEDDFGGMYTVFLVNCFLIIVINTGYWSNPEQNMSPENITVTESLSPLGTKKIVFSDSEIQ